MCSRAQPESGADSMDALDTMLAETTKRCFLCEFYGDIDKGTFVGGDFLCGDCKAAQQQAYEAETEGWAA